MPEYIAISDINFLRRNNKSSDLNPRILKIFIQGRRRGAMRNERKSRTLSGRRGVA